MQDLNDSVRERRRAEAERLNRLPCIIRWDVTSGGGGGLSGGAEGAGSRSAGVGKAEGGPEEEVGGMGRHVSMKGC